MQIAAAVPVERMLNNLQPIFDEVDKAHGDFKAKGVTDKIAWLIQKTSSDIRRLLTPVDRFDAVRRLSVLELSHDPETYVGSQHTGRVSVALLIADFAMEFNTVRPPEDPRALSPEELQRLSDLAASLIDFAQAQYWFTDADPTAPIASAAHLALLADLNWAPPAWPEDRAQLLERLLDGPVAELMTETFGFTGADVMAVSGAISEANQMLAAFDLVGGEAVGVPRAAIYALTDTPSGTVDRVLEFFGTRSEGTDDGPFSRIRRLREHPVLLLENEVCCPVADLLPWSLQLRIEAALLQTPLFNTYQNHRGRILEREANRMLSEVLQPEMNLEGYQYKGSLGEGELDGLLIVDEYAIVVEAKAKTLSRWAWDGQVDRLRVELNDILGMATNQIARFRDTLRTDGFGDTEEEGLPRRRDQRH